MHPPTLLSSCQTRFKIGVCKSRVEEAAQFRGVLLKDDDRHTLTMEGREHVRPTAQGLTTRFDEVPLTSSSIISQARSDATGTVQVAYRPVP